MKKKLLFVLICILMILSISPISAMNDEPQIDVSIYENYVEDLLRGFYSDRYDAFEIYYEDSDIDNKLLFYNQTKLWYFAENYRSIIDYLAEQKINVVEDANYDNFGVMPLTYGTSSFTKYSTKTYNPVYGVPVKIEVKFTGAYTKYNSNNVITSVSANYTITEIDGTNSYTPTYANKSLTKTINGTTATLKLKMDLSFKYTILTQTFTYPGTTFTVTIP